MKIEKIPEGYFLARKGGNGCELWRTFNGAESFACEAIDELIAERDALRAKIEAMEKQEPIGEIQRANSTGNYICAEVWVPLPVGSKLYALPGAQPAPSVPDDILRDAARYRFLRAAKSIPISSKAARDPVVYDEAIDAAMLAAALKPEGE